MPHGIQPLFLIQRAQKHIESVHIRSHEGLMNVTQRILLDYATSPHSWDVNLSPT